MGLQEREYDYIREMCLKRRQRDPSGSRREGGEGAHPTCSEVATGGSRPLSPSLVPARIARYVPRRRLAPLPSTL